MSRCFPFPPPGYVKKARGDDVDLLNKEKQKEKTHKKEKKDKDKEKREKKEKKDRSDGKHKDKKDKKEKHKDKDKDKKNEKSRDKEKDGSNNSEEKKFPDHPAGQNGEKTSDKKKFPGKSEGHSGEKFIPKEKGIDIDRSSISGEKKLAGHISSYNGEKIRQNSHLAEDFRDSKIVQELAGRVRDDGAEARSQLADKLMGTDRKRDEGMVSFVAKTANNLAEEKEKINSIDDRKFDMQGIGEETRAGGNAMVPNLFGAIKARVDGIPKQVENHTERQGGGRVKEGNDKIRDKRKDKDREKKSDGKDKDRDKKEKKKKEKKAKSEHRNLELNNLNRSNKDEPVDTINLKTSHHPKEGNKGAFAEENLHKWKDSEKNGFLHVDDIKLSETCSAQPLAGNGRTSESCQAAIPFTLGSKGVDNKKRKVNGIIEAQLLSVSPTKHLSSVAQATQIDEVSIKPPHPDAKYLSQVLSVPKMEEWSGFDDQSWLSIESQSKKPKVRFSEIDEPPQVWAEAVQIESADVCALPYVIPY